MLCSPRVAHLRGIAVGAASLVLLTAIKLGFADAIGHPTPFLLYFGAVVAAAWYGGYPAGFLTTLVAGLLGDFLFVLPAHEFTGGPIAIAQTSLFLVEGVVLTMLTARFRGEQERSRLSERDARLSQEWLATALRSIGDAVITTDRQGQVTFLNPVAVALTGWSVADARGRPLAEVFPVFDEATRAPAESPAARVLGEVVVGVHNRHVVLRPRDGRELPIAERAAAIRSDAGELVGVVLVFRDVSADRKEEAQRALLAQAVAELSSSLDYQTTLATVVRLAVPAVADWCAVDMVEDGALARLAVAHVDPAKIEFVRELERRYPPDPHATSGVPNVARTGQAELMSEIPAAALEAVARDAEHLQLIRALALRSYIAVPIHHDGRVVGVISLVMAESQRTYDAGDLAFATQLADRAAIAIENASAYREAERLRAEAAADRDRLAAMIAAAPISICMLRGPELEFELMNEPYRARFGGRAQPGGKLTDLGPEARSVELVRQVFRSGQPAAMVEYPSTAEAFADGRLTHYVNFTLQPLRDTRGEVDRVVVFAHDVTDQVLARQRVDAARVQAELASRSKDEFLAMLGHELRNPLAPIVTALQLMDLRAGGTLSRERAIIDRQVKHVVRLVDDLLDVSRITRGRVALERELITAADVVAKALEMVGPLLEQRAHQVTTAVAPELHLHGDPVRLAQVLGNVITNAAKYTEKGGHIAIGGAREGDQVVLTVRDDGIGIAPEMLPRVFELFVQERQALDRSQGGLGLGLAIVRSLVTLHGGTVEAQSEGLGRGTELIIRLPAATVLPVASTPPVSRSPAPATPGQRVMLVDDNADALELLSTALEVLGYQTVQASDGAEALVVAERERPTIALLDIGLPVMNGYELARRLREMEGLRPLRLVALTGYGQPADREAALAAGFDEHLVKPVTIEAVAAALGARVS